MSISLEVFYKGECIFSSEGKWLHPLFELEEFLTAQSYSPETLLVRDKIVGKAAALLLVRLGMRRIAAGVLSRLAQQVLDRHHISYRFEQSVDRIDCQTEALLAEIDDPEAAYSFIRERARRSAGRDGSAGS